MASFDLVAFDLVAVTPNTRMPTIVNTSAHIVFPSRCLPSSITAFGRVKLKLDPYDEEPASHVYENSLISWSCVVGRQQWYRCLEKDYLNLKCFLLERFMHDVLFESSSSLLLRRFLELD